MTQMDPSKRGWEPNTSVGLTLRKMKNILERELTVNMNGFGKLRLKTYAGETGREEDIHSFDIVVSCWPERCFQVAMNGMTEEGVTSHGLIFRDAIHCPVPSAIREIPQRCTRLGDAELSNGSCLIPLRKAMTRQWWDGGIISEQFRPSERLVDRIWSERWCWSDV